MSFLNKICKQFLKGRLKGFVIMQAFLVIPIIAYFIFTYTNDEVNYFYCGLAFINIAIIILLRSIEKFVLKQSGYIADFILFLIPLYMGIDYIINY
ncbi:hypothetical protein [Gottfriedia solisilvae]|uniref:hypothetical protein n=1 Tax=Gottfriedia solisilvae TaxID=1516104 RepID=UPI003D2EFF04